MAIRNLPNPAILPPKELPHVPCAPRLLEEYLRRDARWSPSGRGVLLSCSAKKPRTCRRSRPTKSSAQLCNELHEFVFSAGLPDDHVPSTKELLEYGRKDLANIVRRRGYKEITKLLLNSSNGNVARDLYLCTANNHGQESIQEFTEDQDTQGNERSELAESSQRDVTSHSQNADIQIIRGSEDTMINNCYKLGSLIHDTEGLTKSTVDLQLSYPLTRKHHSSRNFYRWIGTVNSDKSFGQGDGALLDEVMGKSAFDENQAFDLYEEKANQDKINHLKEMLRHKEMELEVLKQQIEEEKFALSMMHDKSHLEIHKIQNIIAQKDRELDAAEESLSGLREVLIEYWGKGETVEVAGSFNGWQHHVKMDPNTPSRNAGSNGTRELMLWSTILWLYPGVYEIKFVVDGQWKIDAQREFITTGSFTNNILRVQR